MIEEILESDHAEIDGLFKAVFLALDAADLEEVYRTLDFFWARLAMHIRAEHLRLFPAVRSITSHDSLLEDLRTDHDFFMVELARAIKAARIAFHFGNEPETFTIIRKILERVRERLVAHNSKEENELYPLAAKPFISDAQMDEIAAGLRKELGKYPARFAVMGNSK